MAITLLVITKPVSGIIRIPGVVRDEWLTESNLTYSTELQNYQYYIPSQEYHAEVESKISMELRGITTYVSIRNYQMLKRNRENSSESNAFDTGNL